MQRRSGQAVVEYILMVALVTFTIAITIRLGSRSVYSIWSSIAARVASACAKCAVDQPPQLTQ